MLVIVRKAHPLLGAFPLAVMAVAIVLVAFAFAMAAAGHAKGSGLASPSGLGAWQAVPGQSR
jgi:hypothetical protein